MDVRRQAVVRMFAKSAAYAFVFPVLFMLVFGAPSMLSVLVAGLVGAVTAGPLMGLTFGYIVPWTKRLPFMPAIVVQFGAFFGFGVLMFALNVWIVSAAINKAPLFDAVVVANAEAFFVGPTSRQILALGVALFIVLVVVEQVWRKLGPGVALNWMSGKYHRPREEERVFMFLDLKDSTPIAERLGSLEFSALIQDFFNDLSWAVLATKACVSHYIGDEAVIVWPPSRAFKDDNCVRLYFRMKEEISRRAPYYSARYGVVPEFKAGVHLGPVVAAEVGRAKSEIVYHGDAVNTTARIVGLCAQLGSDLLVSRAIVDRLSGVRTTPLGLHTLKGKSEPVELFAVSVQ